MPFGPWAGDKDIAGVVMVKVAEAVSAGTEPTSLPEAVTEYPPAELAGTVNVHVNVPVDDVVWEVHVWVPGVAPLKVKVPMAVLTEKPDPVTVTEIPLGPCDGVSVIEGVVTVKAADMMKLVPVVPCDTSTYPLPEDGTVSVVPLGIPPAAVEVNVVVVPLGHAAVALELKHIAYTVLGA
jgi:hypothetical protein